MNIVNICPTCKESISTTPLVDILVTYQEDLTREEIYEQGWHKRCYPPALLAVLEMVIEAAAVYDTDELTPGQIEIRQAAKEAGMLPAAYVMKAVRAAIAEARGE